MYEFEWELLNPDRPKAPSEPFTAEERLREMDFEVRRMLVGTGRDATNNQLATFFMDSDNFNRLVEEYVASLEEHRIAQQTANLIGMVQSVTHEVHMEDGGAFFYPSQLNPNSR